MMLLLRSTIKEVAICLQNLRSRLRLRPRNFVRRSRSYRLHDSSSNTRLQASWQTSAPAVVPRGNAERKKKKQWQAAPVVVPVREVCQHTDKVWIKS
eukprot:COSAG02_NODE_7412_length_3027_cov_10.277664_3_plen_97_part_00